MFGALASLPSIPLAPEPTPIEELSRLRSTLGGGPRLLVKRDDAIRFAFGGNEVRKMSAGASRPGDGARGGLSARRIDVRQSPA